MNRTLETLAQRKQILQARSTLCRLRIRSELNAMHDRLSWARAGVAAAVSSPIISSTVTGLALYGVAHGRLGRWLMLAAQALLLARLAGAAVNLFRKRPVLPPSVR